MATARRSAPRIILSGRKDDDEEGRASELMDWETRFGGRSPLARKVITFNLVALGVLVAGVLYLNQFQDGLIVLRERSMQTEGRIIAQSISSRLMTESLPEVTQAEMIRTLRSFADNTSSRLWLFNTSGRFLAGSGINTQETSAEAQAVQPTQPSAFTIIFNDMWNRTERLFSDVQGQDLRPINSQVASPVAMRSIADEAVVSEQTTNEDGQLVLMVAVPIRMDDQVVGALALSSPPGDIDAFVRGEREQILQVFALAILSSILLSLVLANTIVRPLRYLAEAAQQGGVENRHQVNPERIDIPDLTGRPDEIGYLSGAMLAMTTALYDRIEANEVFAADVAHEIKNPLTSLRSAVDTMPYAKDDESRGKLLSVIRQDVNRLDRLVTDISNASRLDSELVKDEREQFNLHEQLNNLVEYNQALAEEKLATLESRGTGEELMIRGLAGRLAQVFVNLITNAISFSKEGDRVTVSTQKISPRLVRVLVEDTGPGIPDGNLKDVFKRFYSERPTQQFGNNSGLGLAISKQIVDAHGGRIWAENIRPEGAGIDTPSKGARFVVELPI